VLLKFLLRGVALSSYAPASSAAATRPAEADARLLYACLSAMYARAEEFGGGLFALAAGVMTDLIHHEPQSYRQLQESGLTEAFLAAVKVRRHRVG
jgi:E3 ubiquitin-protein ligase HUWE1